MVRINLLPPEVIEKRKAEKVFGYILMAALAAAVLLVVAYAFTAFVIGGRSKELQSKRDMAEGLQRKAEAFRVFEAKEQDLKSRSAVVETALDGRVDWARLFTEVSLVLPLDMWATNLRVDEDNKPNLELRGKALDPEDSPDAGHKVIAKALVRFAELSQLENVWLTESRKAESDVDSLTLDFTITSDVIIPSSSAKAAAGAVPAPPSGQ